MCYLKMLTFCDGDDDDDDDTDANANADDDNRKCNPYVLPSAHAGETKMAFFTSSIGRKFGNFHL